MFSHPKYIECSVSRFAYPFAICTGFVALSALSEVTSYGVAAYIAAVCGATLATLHEWLLPERIYWHPTIFDVKNDVAYMLLGQVLLEQLLVLSALLAIASIVSTTGWHFEGLWPVSWPIWVQAILVLVLGDFLRYWMHRAFHYVGWMWRLHTIHHSPDKLYWVNVGRFHPIEQTLQFLVDALPFIVLGVSSDVLSTYFVFYAINGFYQHSNCRVRLGWLIWIVAGPELHRWHHSKVVEEANHNFGNNLVVWDIVFGTRYLPIEIEVGDLGVQIPAYPMSFLQQLIAPFNRRLNATNAP